MAKVVRKFAVNFNLEALFADIIGVHSRIFKYGYAIEFGYLNVSAMF